MNTLVVIMGPTAVGKTALAIRLAQLWGSEILSCDSRQFYEELNVGVARPSEEELAAAKHHFIACRSVRQPYNAWQYGQDANDLIKSLFPSHETLIAVGGSGLYIDALCQGIALLPDPTPELRERLSQTYRTQGIEPLQKELLRLDPEYFSQVDQNNPARLQRALEVCLTANKPYSEVLRQELKPRDYRIVKVALECDRETLRERISLRVDQMMVQGLLDEVESLQSLRQLNTLNTVGYKEFFSFLDGNITKEQAIQQVKDHTWQYAKKQLTWLRRYSDIHWFPNTIPVSEIAALL